MKREKFKLNICSSDGSLKQVVEIDYRDHVEFELENCAGKPVTCRAYFGTNSVWLGVDRYGNLVESDETATQAGLDVFHHDMPKEYYRIPHSSSTRHIYRYMDHPSAGHAQFLLWSNVNEEEPEIHTLAQARVNLREED